MLTDSEILEAITNGGIKIEPFLKEKIQPGNYRLTLGSKLLLPKKGIRILKDSPEQSMYDELDLSTQSYIIKPKEFLLAQTLEKIGLSKQISAILDGKSTLARLGLSIHQSAQLIVAGEEPQIITLELYNAGEFEIELTLGMKIAKLIFFKFDKPNDRASDDIAAYVGQTETTAPKL
ncbi:MAG: dCTP deaminase [bacterium]